MTILTLFALVTAVIFGYKYLKEVNKESSHEEGLTMTNKLVKLESWLNKLVIDDNGHNPSKLGKPIEQAVIFFNHLEDCNLRTFRLYDQQPNKIVLSAIKITGTTNEGDPIRFYIKLRNVDLINLLEKDMVFSIL